MLTYLSFDETNFGIKALYAGRLLPLMLLATVAWAVPPRRRAAARLHTLRR